MPKERVWLEALLHPIILERIVTTLKNCEGPYCIVCIPLLIENLSLFKHIIHRILVIDVKESVQIQRALKRDKLSTELIQATITAQASRQERLTAANDVIDNSQDRLHLTQQIKALHKIYSQMET